MKKNWILFVLALVIAGAAIKILSGGQETQETEEEIMASVEQKDEDTSLEQSPVLEDDESQVDPAPRDESEDASAGPDEEIESIEENPN